MQMVEIHKILLIVFNHLRTMGSGFHLKNTNGQNNLVLLKIFENLRNLVFSFQKYENKQLKFILFYLKVFCI